jgi:aryl sulfotransferase
MARVAADRQIQRAYRNVVFDNRRWEGFTHRPGDIFVCTPAKCGTTWMQAIVLSVLFPDVDELPELPTVAPWLDARSEPAADVLARLAAQTHRRSIKTHTPADGIPWWPDASYIVVSRDGRDAFMSFVNHIRNTRPELMMEMATSTVADGIELEGTPPPVDDVHELFAWWLDDQPMWFEHVASFWEHRGEPNVLFAHYDDMQADLEGQMRRVAAFIGVEVPQDRWPTLVERCSFDSMKQRSLSVKELDRHFVGGGATFFHKATNGRWYGVLTPDELAAFDDRCRTRLTPEAIEWTNRWGDADDAQRAAAARQG